MPWRHFLKSESNLHLNIAPTIVYPIQMYRDWMDSNHQPAVLDFSDNICYPAIYLKSIHSLRKIIVMGNPVNPNVGVKTTLGAGLVRKKTCWK